MTDYKKDCLTGISYRQRLETLQKRYLGAYKARKYTQHEQKPRPVVPGSECEKIRLTGRY